MITQSIIALVQRKARRMTGQTGLTTSDVEDVEQELLLKVVQGLGSYDPSKGSLDSYASTIVERKAANIVRDRKAERRDPSRRVSLNVTVHVDEGECAELAQQISRRELEARTGSNVRDELEDFQVQQDVAEVIAGLDRPDRELLRSLKWQNLSQIARHTGIPRSTLQDRLTALRADFEKAGLQDYLA